MDELDELNKTEKDAANHAEKKRAAEAAGMTLSDVEDSADEAHPTSGAEDEASGGKTRMVDTDAHMLLAPPAATPGAATEPQPVVKRSDPQLRHFIQVAKRQVATHIRMVLQNEGGLLRDSNDIATEITQSALASVKCKENDGMALSLIGIICDSKLAGECLTEPHLRMPPMDILRLKTLLQAALFARGHDMNTKAPWLAPSDVYLFFNGARQGACMP